MAPAPPTPGPTERVAPAVGSGTCTTLPAADTTRTARPCQAEGEFHSAPALAVYKAHSPVRCKRTQQAPQHLLEPCVSAPGTATDARARVALRHASVPRRITPRQSRSGNSYSRWRTDNLITVLSTQTNSPVRAARQSESCLDFGSPTTLAAVPNFSAVACMRVTVANRQVQSQRRRVHRRYISA